MKNATDKGGAAAEKSGSEAKAAKAAKHKRIRCGSLTGLVMARDERPEDMTSEQMLKRLRQIVGAYMIQNEVWEVSAAREKAQAYTGKTNIDIGHTLVATSKSSQICATKRLLDELAMAFGLDLRECADDASGLRETLVKYGILNGGAE